MKRLGVKADSGSSSPPMVTVIMPTFNASKTLKASIDSVLSQTFPDLELLIGDDASTDTTSLLLDTVTDPRVHIRKYSTNRGPGATRDILMAEARGNWITFCDADDLWHPERITTLMKAAHGNELAVIFDDVMESHSTARGIIPWRRIHGPTAFGARGEVIHVDAAQFIDGRRMLIQPLFPRVLLREPDVRHSSHAYGEDSYFLLKLLAHAKELIYVPNALYFYRISPGSASSNAQRYALLREVLESSLINFETKPLVQAALKRKIHRIRRAELYAPFANAIKERRAVDALRLLVKRPILIREFAAHGLSDVSYHLHRLYHGGSTRGSK